ncbi:MAG: nucleotidyltransferase domain-containing protein [Bdellovibrionales bacterium]
MSLLAKILSSQVRAEIFRLLFTNEQSSIHLRDLQRQSGLSIGTIQKEIAHLKNLDLVISRRDGNRLYYSASRNHPLFEEIRGLVEKTSGIEPKLQEALSKVKGIQCAFIFGSVARGEEKSHSDVDLIVIGEIGLRALTPKLRTVTEQTQREINPHVYSRRSWKEKVKKKDHFITSVISEKKIFLIGDESVLS